jgi:hypothetical protein
MRILIALFSIALSVMPAVANFLTYSEWSALPENAQSMYIAGAYDSLVTFVSTDDEINAAQHYSECVAKSGMTNRQLAQNVRTYAATKPELQGGNVQVALVRYLLELCGKPKS